MVIKTDLTDLQDFEAWSGAEDTKNEICNAGKGEQFITELEQVYMEGMTDSELNDLLWFDPDWCLHLVGLETEQEKKEKQPEHIAEKNGWDIMDIPEWALNYIVNGDAEGLNDNDKDMVDAFLQDWDFIEQVKDEDGEDEEAEFNNEPQFGMPCDTVRCYCEKKAEGDK